jgi:anti-sigma regulatory factor (Ser/Thr protein kinase)
MIFTELRIRNRMEDMSAVVAMVDEFYARFKIPEAAVNDLNLCLDELICNTISYGYPDDGVGAITVRLVYTPGQLRAEIHDDGVAFNPLEAEPPNLTGSVQTRKVGGVGIHFVKELMDDIVYQRVGDENQLTLTKNID